MNNRAVPSFDLSMIRTVCGNDTEMEQELIKAFISETRKNLERLNACTTNGISQNWVDVAHSMKGGASNIGATELKELCLTAQKMNAPSTTMVERLALSKRIHTAAHSLINALQQRTTNA